MPQTFQNHFFFLHSNKMTLLRHNGASCPSLLTQDRDQLSLSSKNVSTGDLNATLARDKIANAIPFWKGVEAAESQCISFMLPVPVSVRTSQMFRDILTMLTWLTTLDGTVLWEANAKSQACGKEPALLKLCFVIVSEMREVFLWQQATCAGRRQSLGDFVFSFILCLIA